MLNHQDQKLERLQAIPRRLPDAIIQPKVTFIPGRKRALTGREAADLQEKEEARQRRRAQIEAEKQAQNDARQEQYTIVRSQFQTEVADTYAKSHDTGTTESHSAIDISSGESDTSESKDESEDIDIVLTQIQSTAPLSSSILSTRERKPTSKQASQNQRTTRAAYRIYTGVSVSFFTLCIYRSCLFMGVPPKPPGELRSKVKAYYSCAFLYMLTNCISRSCLFMGVPPKPPGELRSKSKGLL